MPTVIHCPSCERKLKVPETLLGKKVKCPSCGTLFTGAAADEELAEDELEESAPEEERPTARVTSAPSRRREAEVPDEPDERDEEDDRPRRRRRLRRDGEPHRGPLVMVLGIISVVNSLAALLVCCSPPVGICSLIALGLGIPSWVMGARDLRRMSEGTMDPEGRGTTTAGYVCGIIGTIGGGLSLLLTIVAILAFFGLFAFSATQQGKFPQQNPNVPGRPRFQVEPTQLPRLQDYLPRRSLGGAGVLNS